MTNRINMIALVLAAGTAPGTAFAQYAGQPASVTGTLIRVVLWTVFIVACLAIYLAPSIVAFKRGHPNRMVILLVNFVFGGTIIGWVGSLIWALNVAHRSPTGSNGGESGLNLFVNDPKTVNVKVAQTSPSHEAELTEKLQRLKRLFDSGALDAEEYAALRKPIMEQLFK